MTFVRHAIAVLRGELTERRFRNEAHWKNSVDSPVGRPLRRSGEPILQIFGRLRLNMPHAQSTLGKTNRSVTHTNINRPATAYVSDAVRSWIKNVIAPALVKALLAEQTLHKGEVRA